MTSPYLEQPCRTFEEVRRMRSQTIIELVEQRFGLVEQTERTLDQLPAMDAASDDAIIGTMTRDMDAATDALDRRIAGMVPVTFDELRAMLRLYREAYVDEEDTEGRIFRSIQAGLDRLAAATA